MGLPHTSIIIMEIVFHTYLYRRSTSALIQRARRFAGGFLKMRPFAQKCAASIGKKHKVMLGFLPDVPQFFRGLNRHLLPDIVSRHLTRSQASPCVSSDWKSKR